MEKTYHLRLLKSSIGIAIIFWLLIYSVSLAANNTEDFQKKLHKEFVIAPDGQVDLSNKFGEIRINGWDKNIVEIEVTITVDARNQQKANEVFDRIHIAFDHNADWVSAQTLIDDKKSWWNIVTSNFSSGSDKFQIDYLVHMPYGCKLDVSNKYGNLYIDQLNNFCDINVKYGNFTIDQINADMDIRLGYGNGQLRKTLNADCELKYSKLTILDIKDLDIESKYSKIIIDKANNIETESKYDGYDIGTISSLIANGKYDHYEIELVRDLDFSSAYTNLKIDELTDKAQLYMSYGTAKIKKLHKGFDAIKGTGKYLNFIITIEEGASYSYELTTKYGGITVPDEDYNSISEDHAQQISGRHGSQAQKSSIQLKTAYGKILLKER